MYIAWRDRLRKNRYSITWMMSCQNVLDLSPSMIDNVLNRVIKTSQALEENPRVVEYFPSHINGTWDVELSILSNKIVEVFDEFD